MLREMEYKTGNYVIESKKYSLFLNFLLEIQQFSDSPGTFLMVRLSKF